MDFSRFGLFFRFLFFFFQFSAVAPSPLRMGHVLVEDFLLEVHQLTVLNPGFNYMLYLLFNTILKLCFRLTVR
jgi:hypothetical protein